MSPLETPPSEVLDLLASQFGTRDRVVYLCQRAGLPTFLVPDIHEPRRLWTSIWTQAQQGSALTWPPLMRAAAADLPHNSVLAAQVAQADRSVVGPFRTSSRIDVGVITIKEEEFEALLAQLVPSEVISGTLRDYDVATLDTHPVATRVAITRCVLPGNTYAQVAASELASDLSPSFVLVVGIAGGIPTLDFCLGDVIVSSFIHDLSLEDTGTNPDERQYDGLGGPLHPSATRIVERLRAIERLAAWRDVSVIGMDRPSLKGEFTTGEEKWNDSIASALHMLGQRDVPIARADKIASSNRLIKDPELVKGWRKVVKGVVAVEMETAGVYIFCQRNNLPVIAVRAISDIIGWKRDEAWTLYACHTAAAYAKMLLQSGVFQRSR